MPVRTVLPLRPEQHIKRGATWKAIYRWSPAGIPMDFTGWAARFNARYRASDPTLALDLTTANGGVTLSNDGIITITATDEQTALLQGSGLYDLFLDAPNGDVTPLLSGRFILERSVIR